MIQFTKQEIEGLKVKAKLQNWIISWLENQVIDLMGNEIKVPHTALATWSLYYFCPEHSVRLKFNINKMHEHVCPVDGKVFKGEPYDGAWWVTANETNSKGGYLFALLWLLTEDKKYFEKAKTILIEYAKYYPGYEIHGNIPHNKQGKAFSQTMSDAQWIRFMAMNYDIVRDSLSTDERTFIEENLLSVCGEFLMQNRINQVHNHEVLISVSVAMIGMLLSRKDMIDFSIYEKYGLVYQIENAFLKDGLWFEVSLHYQAYIMEMLTFYEKFFKNTEHKLERQPYFKKMFDVFVNVLQPDYEFPRINDDLLRYDLKDTAPFYELAYCLYGERSYAWLLNRCYEKTERKSLDAFLYGVLELPDVNRRVLKNYHNDDSGLTVFRGENDSYLLVKHSPFAGEHDHYDRLGLSFMAFGEKIAVDFGTTGYGAKLHYDYYKNTGSHNTIVINEDNQPPTNSKVLKYEKINDYIILDTIANWDDKFNMIDTHTSVEWNTQSYQNVSMRRVILWCDGYFIEVCQVKSKKERIVDWVLHVAGELELSSKMKDLKRVFSNKKPFKYLKEVKYIENPGNVKTTWKLNNCDFNLYSYSGNNNTLYFGNAPDNPSVKDVSYFINRVKGNGGLFINVFEASHKKTSLIKFVNFNVVANNIEVVVNITNNVKKYNIFI